MCLQSASSLQALRLRAGLAQSREQSRKNAATTRISSYLRLTTIEQFECETVFLDKVLIDSSLHQNVAGVSYQILNHDVAKPSDQHLLSVSSLMVARSGQKLEPL
eukprot:4247076-Amphidinium_carterae.1